MLFLPALPCPINQSITHHHLLLVLSCSMGGSSISKHQFLEEINPFSHQFFKLQTWILNRSKKQQHQDDHHKNLDIDQLL
jgi:hypothetical protein